MINIFLNRVFRAIKIDIELFEEVEKDKNATVQAGIVVVLSSLAAGIGAIHLGASNLIFGPLISLASWYFWAFLIFIVGTKLFPDKQTKVSFKTVLTAVGFAHAPGLLRFFAVTPDLMIPLIFLTQFWIFAGLIISTKQILSLRSNFKSFGIILLSFLIIAFLSISFVMSRMNMLPVSQIS